MVVGETIVDHLLEKPASRWDGFDAFFLSFPDLITDQYEIWESFAQSEASGRMAVRRRYVKAVRVDKNRMLGLWDEFQHGQWVAEDFFQGGITALNNLRKGRLLYWKK